MISAEPKISGSVDAVWKVFSVDCSDISWIVFAVVLIVEVKATSVAADVSSCVILVCDVFRGSFTVLSVVLLS